MVLLEWITSIAMNATYMCPVCAWNGEFGKYNVPGALENVPFAVATWLIIVSEKTVLPPGYTCALLSIRAMNYGLITAANGELSGPLGAASRRRTGG
jgi:hypothetical protein